MALREVDTPRARLISVMRAFKGFNNAILSGPHFSQDCAVTNIGVTERWLADAWYANGTPNRNLDGEESPVFQVVNLAVGRRVTQPSPYVFLRQRGRCGVELNGTRLAGFVMCGRCSRSCMYRCW